MVSSALRGKVALARMATGPVKAAAVRYGAYPDVVADADWWIECIDDGDLTALARHDRLAWLTGALPEFRSLLHERLRAAGAPAPVRWLLRRIYRGEPTLHINVGSLGRALFIQHGVATMVVAESIGEHCWINQQVTIGHDANGRPTLGDRVRVGAGAVVFGPITLHDDATIGANATVAHDVPAGVTMVAPLAVPLDRPTGRPPEGSAADSA